MMMSVPLLILFYTLGSMKQARCNRLHDALRKMLFDSLKLILVAYETCSLVLDWKIEVPSSKASIGMSFILGAAFLPRTWCYYYYYCCNVILSRWSSWSYSNKKVKIFYNMLTRIYKETITRPYVTLYFTQNLSILESKITISEVISLEESEFIQ